MKKFILTMLIGLLMSFSVNAQIATENAKLFDNTYVGVEAGVATPLDFNSVFPLNTVAGVKLGKEITPVFGVEAEGQIFFNDNNVGRWTNTFVKGTNVGLNGTVNVSNLVCGYKGTPRFFEIKTNTGLGWLHRWNNGGDNALTAKTALDVNFNIGKTKAHTLSVTPGVWWVISDNGPVRFDKRAAQLAVFVGYTYHFKTSNGTRHFKTYDVGAMLSEIDRLNAELAKKPTEVVREVVREVPAQPVTNAVATVTTNDVYIFFAQNSDILTDVAKAALDNVTGTVEIIATASPEGTADYNQVLSQRRADAVKTYLEGRGVTVTKATGLGVQGDASGRVSVVTIK